MRQRFPFLAVLLSAGLVAGAGPTGRVPDAYARDAAASAAASAAAPRPVPQDEVDKLVGRAVEGPKARRDEALVELARLGPGAVPPLEKRLNETRRTANAAATSALLKSVRGDALDGVATARGADPVAQRSLLTSIVIQRALLAIGGLAALRPVVQMAADAQGAFRPELGRRLKAMGDPAVPALVAARADASADVRNFAHGTLDAMGKRVPSDFVQVKGPAVLADVLRAFGIARDLEAVPVVLSFTNHDKVLVRDAAREALLAYGPDAMVKLRETYAGVVGKPAPEGLSYRDLARALFAAYDDFRLQDTYALVEEAEKKQSAGDLAGAIALYEKVFAQKPRFERRHRAVEAHLQHARAIKGADRAEALRNFRRALALLETGPGPLDARVTNPIESEVAYLTALDLRDRGVTDVSLLKRALELDPANLEADTLLRSIEAEAEQGSRRLWQWGGGAIVTTLAMAIGVLLLGRRRSPR